MIGASRRRSRFSGWLPLRRFEMAPIPRRWPPLLVGAACALAAAAPADPLEPLDAFYHPYRADVADAPRAGVPPELHLLPRSGPQSWPEPLRTALAERVRAEWPAARRYGPLRAGVGLWLAYPLVTVRLGERVAIPVLEERSLPVRGVLALPRSTGRRRVVLLIDASSSANAPVWFRGAGGAPERIRVLEAERRAVDQLLPLLDDSRVELGVIAFGEGTWPVVPLGTPRQEARERLAEFRRRRPRGEGRTDTVCALWTARDWLDDTPDGVGREVVLLTDGDLPHSGRFLDCRPPGRRRTAGAEARCEARRNRSPCPSRHGFRGSDGHSDQVQLAAFARRARRDVDVYPLIFEPDRSARPYRELARRTGGALWRIRGAAAIEAALPALVSRRIRRVVARNATTGAETPDLHDPATGRFTGSLPLASGANDVEVRIEGERGVAGLYRYRVYSLPGALEGYLAEVRAANQSLDERVEALQRGARPRPQPVRLLEVAPAPAPASRD